MLTTVYQKNKNVVNNQYMQNNGNNTKGLEKSSSFFLPQTDLKKAVKVAIEDGLSNLEVENVDIIEESDYNEYNTKERTNKIYSKISDNERAQVASEVLQWRQDEANGIHYIDLSTHGYKSYIYSKTGKDIETLLRIDGTEDFRNYIRKGVEDGTYKKSTSLDGWIANIKSEYRRHSNDNDVLSNGRNGKTNDRTYTRTLRQQRKNNNGEITSKNSRNELIKNSEQSSFSLPKTDNQGRTLTKEQIKNIDNTTPTANSDIRYSQSDKSWSKYLKEYWGLMPNSTKTFALPSAEELKKFDNEQNKKAYESLHNINETDNIPIEQLIKYKDKNSGGYREQEQINSLKENIRKNGIKNPIELITDSKGNITINDRNHRLTIEKELGIRTVPVKYLDENAKNVVENSIPKEYNEAITERRQQNANGINGAGVSSSGQDVRIGVNGGYNATNTVLSNETRATAENSEISGGEQRHNNRPSIDTTRRQDITGQKIKTKAGHLLKMLIQLRGYLKNLKV